MTSATPPEPSRKDQVQQQAGHRAQGFLILSMGFFIPSTRYGLCGSKACLQKLKYKNIQVLSHTILSSNFKFLIPSVFGNKNPFAPNQKSHAGNPKFTHIQIKNLVPGIFKKSMLRIKNHLHPNKKPYARVKKPMLRIKKPMLVVLGRGKKLTGTNGIFLEESHMAKL